MTGLSERKTSHGSWSEDDIKNAFKAIKQEGITVYKAIQTFIILHVFLAASAYVEIKEAVGLNPL